MQIIGIIPVRYNSSRFPGKPLVPILGKTLIERTYLQAKQCTLLHTIVIATDDERIFAEAKRFGAHVVMTSESCLNGTERMADVIRTYPEFASADIYINIQGDEPTVEATIIDTLVSIMIQHPNEQMATLITPITDSEKIRSPSTCKCVFDKNGHALYFSRSEIPYKKQNYTTYKHIGLYAFRRDFLLHYVTMPNTPLQLAEDLEMLKVLENGYKIRVCEVQSQSIDVNNPEDIQKVEELLCKQSQT